MAAWILTCVMAFALLWTPSVQSLCMREILEFSRERCQRWQPWRNREASIFLLYHGHPGFTLFFCFSFYNAL